MNHHSHYRSILKLCACLLAMHSGISAAANDDRWFRVELLVFSHNTGAAAEDWDPTPALRYPEVGRFLVQPELLAANQSSHDGEVTVDERGRLHLLLPTDEPAGADAPALTEDAAPTAPAAEPTPFRVLPGSQREFRGKAAYMQRTGRYSTLFHQVWLQPVTSRERTLPLVIDRSGDTGEWPQLQGSVTLYLSRYLHLETNLWLNTAGDYLPGTWRMPDAPFGPPSLLVEEAEKDALAEPPLVVSQDPAPGQGGPEDAIPGMEVELDPGPVSPYRHAVLLQQKRRMRSNEVHYIDHPMLGLVVKLTPVAQEDLALFADAEESGDYPPLEP